MGRIPTKLPEQRYYQIEYMWEKNHEVCRMLMLGMSNVEIAKIIGCTAQNISDMRNSSLMQSRLAVLKVARDSATVDVSRAIIEEGPKCLQLLTDIRDGNINGEMVPIVLRAHVAQDLLDRNPQTAKTKNLTASIQHDHRIVREETITKIKERARSAAIAEGAVSEADFEVIPSAHQGTDG